MVIVLFSILFLLLIFLLLLLLLLLLLPLSTHILSSFLACFPMSLLLPDVGAREQIFLAEPSSHAATYLLLQGACSKFLCKTRTLKAHT